MVTKAATVVDKGVTSRGDRTATAPLRLPLPLLPQPLLRAMVVLPLPEDKEATLVVVDKEATLAEVDREVTTLEEEEEVRDMVVNELSSQEVRLVMVFI